MFVYVAIIVSIIGLLVATYTDLKERIVKNKLNFGLAGAGLLIYAIQSIYTASIFPIFYSFFGLCLGFFFGWILWKIGVFAGGDVKLFMALGALNPFTPALLKYPLLVNYSFPIFPITLFVYSLFAFLPYGMAVLIYKISRRTQDRKKIFSDLKSKTLLSIGSAIIISTIHTITIYFTGAPQFIPEAIAIIIIIFAVEKAGKFKKYLYTATIIIGIYANYYLYLQILIGVAIIVVVFYGILRLMLSSRILLSSKIKVSDIEEGMIPAKSLIKKGKKYVWIEGLSLKKMIDYALKGRTAEIISEKNEIVSANKARGFTIQEAQELKMLSKKGLIEKSITIKDSMPFVPAMLISYIMCLLLGDLIINLIMVIK